VNSFLTAIVFSVVMTILSYILYKLID
jgi:hypothetical protein